jgi:hypothetical protein
LDKFSLTHKILAFVEDEKSNLQVCENALISIVSCNNLDLLEPFDGTCFGHALSIVCKYVIANEKVPIGLPFVFIKAIQSSIQNYITWP